MLSGSAVIKQKYMAKGLNTPDPTFPIMQLDSVDCSFIAF